MSHAGMITCPCSNYDFPAGNSVSHIRGLSKMFVEFVNKNKTTILITFKFVYNLDTFTMDINTKF